MLWVDLGYSSGPGYVYLLNWHPKCQLRWEARMAQDEEAGGLSSVLL